MYESCSNNVHQSVQLDHGLLCFWSKSANGFGWFLFLPTERGYGAIGPDLHVQAGALEPLVALLKGEAGETAHSVPGAFRCRYLFFILQGCAKLQNCANVLPLS